MKKNNNNYFIDEYGNIHYQGDELARGGQGVVFRTKNDKNLAVKQPLDANGNPDRKSDLKETFHKIRALAFPEDLHISLPLAILRDEPGYVMKLLNGMKPFSAFSLDGETRSKIKSEGLPEWLRQVQDEKFAQDLFFYAKTGAARARLYALYKCAAILARLHNMGIVYGDVSPNNAFLGDGIPCDCWLIDADNLRPEFLRGGTSFYTPGLGAPEIVRGEDSSRPRTDCWAFAVMAFQMLSLCHPFIGKKILESEEECGWDNDSKNEDGRDLDDMAYAGLLPFIDDDADNSNEFRGGLPRQLIFTKNLRKIFQETLGIGRTRPHRRISMSLWALELARAFDNSLVCPDCGMSYFHGAETNCCPYCRAPCPRFVEVKTKKWRITRNFPGGKDGKFELPLPYRLFDPFSLAKGDSTKYEAEIDLKNKTAAPPRGAEPFPPGLTFEFK